MAVLNVYQYLGGPDNIKISSAFPSTQKTVLFDFARDITGWTFEVDHQTLVVDAITYDRYTGEANFATSNVIGSFPKQEVTGEFVPAVVNAALGTVKVFFPADMYSGPIVPDARNHVPITILSVTWTDSATPANIETYRFAIIQSWEPDVQIADPVLDANCTPFALGA